MKNQKFDKLEIHCSKSIKNYINHILITNSLHLILKIHFYQPNSTKSNQQKFSLKTKTNKIIPLISKNEQISQSYITVIQKKKISQLASFSHEDI